MDNVFLRTMQKNEVELCAELIRQGFGTVAKDFGLTRDNCPTNGAFMTVERMKADINKGNQMYVLCDADKIMGFMELEKVDDERIELRKLTVLSEYRHYGYGTKMLNFAKSQAKALGARQLTIGIIEENTVLKEWYIKNGFIHTGTHVFQHLPFTVGFLYFDTNNLDK